MPKVLIADKMSPAATQVFKQRAGLSKEELIKIIPEYDGLAVRSSTRPDAEIITQATNLKVIGRAGIGVDNIDIKALSETPSQRRNMQLPCSSLPRVKSLPPLRAHKMANGQSQTSKAWSSSTKRSA